VNNIFRIHCHWIIICN